MPTYEYECIACGIKYEINRAMDYSDAPLCCSYPMKQIYSPPGLSFKGKGWGHQ
jgi:putative FmdB family regulatory protein